MQRNPRLAHTVGTLIALALLAMIGGCAAPASGTPPRGSPPVAGASAIPGSSASQPATLAHFQFRRVGFDYPADWSVRTPPEAAPPFGGITFVGTAPSTAGCTTVGNGTQCGPNFHLAPGTVSVAVYWLDGPMVFDPFVSVAEPEPGGAITAVDGVRAKLTDRSPSQFAGVDREIVLELLDPALTSPVFVLAEIRGPNEEPVVQQVQALLATVHYEPALRPTNGMAPAAAAGAAGAGLRQLAANVEGPSAYGCFPPPGGAPRDGVLSGQPPGPSMKKPLAITCSSAIEGTTIELWRLTLTVTWTAAFDRTAGSASWLGWVELDGNTWINATSGDEIPYRQ